MIERTILSKSLDRQTLTDLVIPFLSVDPDTFHFTLIQTGKHNASYWVDTGDERFVVRIAPPDDAGFLFYERLMMRQEPDLHTLILAETDIPIAEIIGYDFGHTRIDRDYLVMRALSGTPLCDVPGLTPPLFRRSLSQVGEHLRQLHTITATDGQYGYLGAHQPMESQSTWLDAFRIMWNKMQDDIVACGIYTEEEAGAMRNLLELHIEHFDLPVTSSLLHMDIWSQNILIDKNGNVTGLVDFDRALWGDVEIEFAVLDYCGISEPSFWEGYGMQRDESHPAMIRRHFYLLYEIQKYIPIRVWRRNDNAEAMRYKQQSFQMAAELLPR